MKLLRQYWHYLLLLVLPILLYGQFLNNPIVFDDMRYLLPDAHGKLPIHELHFSLFELRSLPIATIIWSESFFGVNLPLLRFSNVLLHISVAITLFVFLQYLFKVVLGEMAHLKLYAFFASLLFALHPISVYAVAYLVQRTSLMAALFSLWAMLAYLHGSVQQKMWSLWCVVPLYYLAVFSKEHVVMLPVILLLFTVLLHADWWAKVKQRWVIFLCLFLIAAVVVAGRKFVIGAAYEINSPLLLQGLGIEMSYPLSVLTQTWLFFKYIALWLLPNPQWMSVDMREPFATSFWSPYLLALLAFMAWGSVAIYCLVKRGRWGLVGFAMVFPWLMFMTELSTVRVQEPFVLYRSYLWLFGASCILPIIAARLSSRLAMTILTVSILAMFPISLERLSTFTHPILLWDDAEKLVKEHADVLGANRIYYNRASSYLLLEQPDKALADIKRAIELHADSSAIYGNMGIAYLQLKDYQHALDAFNKAIDMDAKQGSYSDPRAYQGRATAYEGLGNIAKALDDHRMSCQLVQQGCERVKLIEQLLESAAVQGRK